MNVNPNPSSDESSLTNTDSYQNIVNSNPKPINPAFTFNNYKSGYSLSLSKWFVGGVFLLAIFATIFLLTKGSNFCFFSDHCIVTPSEPIATDLFAFFGGVAAYVIAGFVGVSALPAVGIALVAWLLIHVIH